MAPMRHLAPDLTVVLNDWRYRTIGLHDFTTHKVISPAFGPTGDHRMEGILIARRPRLPSGSLAPSSANLLDIAPTVLHLLGVPVPADMDGRVMTELLDSQVSPVPTGSATMGSAGLYYHSSASRVGGIGGDGDLSDLSGVPRTSYSEEEDAAIQQRLADLGYL